MSYLKKLLGINTASAPSVYQVSAEEFGKLDAHLMSVDEQVTAANAAVTVLQNTIGDTQKAVGLLREALVDADARLEAHQSRLDKYASLPAQSVTMSAVEPQTFEGFGAKPSDIDNALAEALKNGETISITI